MGICELIKTWPQCDVTQMIPHPLFLIPLYHHILLLELLLPAPNNLQHIITKGQEISEEFFLSSNTPTNQRFFTNFCPS